MTEQILDIISKQAQDYYKNTSVIILGSGASAAYKMSGMWALSNHLIDTINVDGAAQADIEAWATFCDLLNNDVDLESALHKVSLSQELTKKVVMATWTLLVQEDLSVFNTSLEDPHLFPLGTLLKHMLRSTAKHIDIITTNYDRLAEYACEQESIYHYSGFSQGYQGRPVKKDYLGCSRQVNIWKVHGSLGWFINQHGVIISLGNTQSIPENFTPLIVTPGIEKYRNTHREPYKTTIHESDNVIDAASAYLCIGFGFNDEHIQEKLVNRCAKDDAKIIVVTHKLSDSAKKLLFEGNSKRYLAIEAKEGHNNSSIIYSSELDEAVELDRDYWSLNGFLNLIF